MNKAEDILKFHFSPNVLSIAAHKIISNELWAQSQKKITKLNKIAEEIGSISFSFTGNNLIHLIFRKFKSALQGNNIIFERRELRTLTYSLTYSENNKNSILSNLDELNIALNTLNSSWRDSYLIGLIDCLLKNWSTKYKDSQNRLADFIISKLEKYEGRRVALVKFKTNKHFLKSGNGDVILGDTIEQLNLPILEITKFLGVPESWITYSYFSRVIVTWYERKKSLISYEIENLVTVQKKHNNSITNKRLISKLIIQANQNEFITIQDNVRQIAFSDIGDPNNTSSWLPFENATNQEQKELIEAKNILNEWITRQFINVFFNVCINDERRKQFWLKYVSKITSFTVYGPELTSITLKRDSRISEYIDARFKTVYSNKDVSAFILHIGDYILIEFSNDGYACCAYKKNSSNMPLINNKINSVDDLRNSSLPMAIQSESNHYFTNDEGRLFHNANWELKFSYWLNEKVIR